MEGDLGGGVLGASYVLFLDLNAVNTVCENLSSCTLRICVLSCKDDVMDRFVFPQNSCVEALTSCGCIWRWAL